MPSPLEIVITKRNALALIREDGWTLRNEGRKTKATKRFTAAVTTKQLFDNRKSAISSLVAKIMRQETPRPVRVQF